MFGLGTRTAGARPAPVDRDSWPGASARVVPGEACAPPGHAPRQSLRGLAAEPLTPARVFGGSCFSGQVWQGLRLALSNRRGEVIIRGANLAGEGPSRTRPYP